MDFMDRVDSADFENAPGRPLASPRLTFLLGPAGAGKTRRCVEEIRAELRSAPEGPPLILLAPKQSTFQLERLILSSSDIAGYARLQIVSFDRLATFILSATGRAPKPPEDPIWWSGELTRRRCRHIE